MKLLFTAALVAVATVGFATPSDGQRTTPVKELPYAEGAFAAGVSCDLNDAIEALRRAFAFTWLVRGIFENVTLNDDGDIDQVAARNFAQLTGDLRLVGLFEEADTTAKNGIDKAGLADILAAYFEGKCTEEIVLYLEPIFFQDGGTSSGDFSATVSLPLFIIGDDFTSSKIMYDSRGNLAGKSVSCDPSNPSEALRRAFTISQLSQAIFVRVETNDDGEITKDAVQRFVNLAGSDLLIQLVDDGDTSDNDAFSKEEVAAILAELFKDKCSEELIVGFGFKGNFT